MTDWCLSLDSTSWMLMVPVIPLLALTGPHRPLLAPDDLCNSGRLEHTGCGGHSPPPHLCWVLLQLIKAFFRGQAGCLTVWVGASFKLWESKVSAYDGFPTHWWFLCSYPVFRIWPVNCQGLNNTYFLLNFSSDIPCFTVKIVCPYAKIVNKYKYIFLWGVFISTLWRFSYIFQVIFALYHMGRRDQGKSKCSTVLDFHFLIVFWQFSTTTAAPVASNIGVSRNEESMSAIRSLHLSCLFFFLV